MMIAAAVLEHESNSGAVEGLVNSVEFVCVAAR